MAPPTGRTMPSDAIGIAAGRNAGKAFARRIPSYPHVHSPPKQEVLEAGGADVPPRVMANLHLLTPQHPQSRCRSPQPNRLAPLTQGSPYRSVTGGYRQIFPIPLLGGNPYRR